MKNKKRFNFPKDIEKALMNLDSIPCTELGVIPGIPGSLFIIAPEQKEELKKIIETLDNIDSKELECWSDEDKRYYSSLLNNADVVLRNCVTR